MTLDLGLGTSAQLIVVAASRAMRIGCRTATPTAEATTPVIIGNREPPIPAKTKTKASAVECSSGGKSFDPSEMPVANSGPVTKPIKEMAIDEAMIFGTLPW